MSNFVHFINAESVTVLDTTNGDQVKFFSTDPRYSQAIDMIRDGEPEAVFTLDTKHALVSFFSMRNEYEECAVTIEDGVGYIKFDDYPEKIEIHSAIVARVLKMHSQGFDCQPMVNFIYNLYQNPNKTAIDELYLFIEACELPITEDGCFIAYKIVRNDYKDIYSGTIDNNVGSRPWMPRALVDDDRNKTCSRGLHFCSKEYLPHYGTGHGARCMLVKIDPADVVSIPCDYNNAKGRAWVYDVIGEVEGEWRPKLKSADYTSSAVVSAGTTAKCYYDETINRYRMYSDGQLVSNIYGKANS